MLGQNFRRHVLHRRRGLDCGLSLLATSDGGEGRMVGMSSGRAGRIEHLILRLCVSK